MTKKELQELDNAWSSIKGLEDYPIICTINEGQDKYKEIPFNELFKEEILVIDKHMSTLNEEKIRRGKT